VSITEPSTKTTNSSPYGVGLTPEAVIGGGSGLRSSRPCGWSGPAAVAGRVGSGRYASTASILPARYD
jgi:hypothetical protein